MKPRNLIKIAIIFFLKKIGTNNFFRISCGPSGWRRGRGLCGETPRWKLFLFCSCSPGSGTMKKKLWCWVGWKMSFAEPPQLFNALFSSAMPILPLGTRTNNPLRHTLPRYRVRQVCKSSRPCGGRISARCFWALRHEIRFQNIQKMTFLPDFSEFPPLNAHFSPFFFSIPTL